ncbi:hypothetical protein PRUPE_3G098000 [Prunus persica]|uniref:Uncharacterized protein n=1 Tax=Prunus persica TaxID=3760 RepID=A0A251PY22_PRUPE|nr:hypothetical protein PRUPE_3G098000 [Prunus persica]
MKCVTHNSYIVSSSPTKPTTPFSAPDTRQLKSSPPCRSQSSNCTWNQGKIKRLRSSYIVGQNFAFPMRKFSNTPKRRRNWFEEIFTRLYSRLSLLDSIQLNEQLLTMAEVVHGAGLSK